MKIEKTPKVVQINEFGQNDTQCPCSSLTEILDV